MSGIHSTSIRERGGFRADSGAFLSRAICHAPWMLIEAEMVDGRTITSWPSVATDVKNVGGKWLDEEVVVDQGLVTSRKPGDLPAFNDKIVEEFSEGRHDEQARSV